MLLVPHCPAQISRKLISTHTHSLWLEIEEGVSTGTHTAQAPALARALLFWFVATELPVFIAYTNYKVHMSMAEYSPNYY